MVFLIPAITASVCDITILILSRNDPLILLSSKSDNIDDNNTTDDDEDVNNSHRLIHQIGYLWMCAGLRVFLLLIPLLYHSYHGTALRCPILYIWLYALTLITVLIHMLSLLLIDPGSLSTLIPSSTSSTTTSSTTFTSEQQHYDEFTRHLWLLLLLSLVSVGCHIVLFLHVRSTAPADADLLKSRRPKVLFYYVKRDEDVEKSSSVRDNERVSLLNNNNNNNGGEVDNNQNNNGHENNFRLSERSHDSTGSTTSARTRRFMLDVQMRLRQAKEEWTKRLDDYRIRSGMIMRDGSMNVGSMTREGSLGGSSISSQGGGDILHPRPLTPFRVMLQLFAYEDVLTNGRLNQIYESDQGAFMVFIPQLLSFLLHGAYDSSPLLEEWILDVCRRNVYFAHRCYWFLRAWSLEQPVGGEGTRLSKTSSLASFEALQQVGENSSSDLGQAATKFLPEERIVIEQLLRRVMEAGEIPARSLYFNGNNIINNNNIESSLLLTSQQKQQQQQSRFGIDFDRGSPTALKSAVESGIIPIDPITKIPSSRHWDCITASRRYGFLPLDQALTTQRQQQQQMTTISGGPSTSSSTTTKKLLIPSPINNTTIPSYFDTTPVFVDALLTIADNLFKVTKEQRTTEFRKQLQLLDCQALPSNAVYVPIQNANHRVWRIVADESIAISTKERVPCIISFEVVEYDKNTEGDGAASSTVVAANKNTVNKSLSLSSKNASTRDVRPLLERVAGPSLRTPDQLNIELPQISLPDLTTLQGPLTEKQLIDKWRFKPRDPHRRDTALEKIAYQMRHGMRKLPIDQMKTQMQAQFEKLKHTQSNLQDKIKDTNFQFTINVPDTFDEDDDEESGSDNFDVEGRPMPLPPNTLEPTASSDIERGLPDPPPNTPYTSSASTSPSKSMLMPDGVPPLPTIPSTPQTTPRSTLVAEPVGIGQWASPHKSRHAEEIGEDTNNNMDNLLLPPLKRASYQHMETDDDDDNDTNDQTRGTGTPLKPGSSPSQGASGGGSSSRVGARIGGCLPGKKMEEPTTPGSQTNKATPPVVFKENWKDKEERIRSQSAFGSHPGWRLLPILIKANDDLRQEQMASQLIYRFAAILARERVPVWLYPYEIIAITDSGGIIEAIPDTISIASLKKNDPSFTSLKGFFQSFFTNGPDDLADAKANFCESLAAYSMVCFLLQIKDRHNGNILMDNRGHIIHIDFGFFFLSSPGKNTGFESAPFKLTREFVDVLDGPDSRLFRIFRMLCYRSFIALRRHCLEIILLVEMLKKGNEELACFRGRPDDAIAELRHRFRLDLNDRACLEYVNALIDESLENWRTNWYDRYQRYCVGVL